MHASGDDNTCQCLTFVLDGNGGGDTCDTCGHSVTWHVLGAGPQGSPSTSVQITSLLSSYSDQDKAFNPKARKYDLKATATEARKEAVAGLKWSYRSDEESSTEAKVFSLIK